MPHSPFARRHPGPRATLVVAATPAAALVLSALAVALAALAAPRTLLAQVTLRTATGAAASALRPEIGVPLSVLVKIGTGGRATVGEVLGAVLRRSGRTSSSKSSSKTSSGSSSKTSSKTSSKPSATPTSAPSSSRGTSATAARVLTTADRYLGVPYVFGGTTPDGFDCSGFVQYVYRRQGVTLPRTAAQQSGAGEQVRVAVKELRAGDLMLFDASSKRPGIDHVAIYAGNGRMIHSSSSGGGVGYDELATKRGRWFVDHMVAARRVVADGRSLVDALSAWAPAELDPPDEAPSPSTGKR